MPRLAIIGSSDLGKLIAQHAIAGDFEVVGFFDNHKPRGTAIEPYGTVIGSADDVEELHRAGHFDVLSVGIGYLQFDYRRQVFERFKDRIPYANVVHQSAVIDPSCVLGEGLVVLSGCVLDVGVRLCDNVLLNTGVVVAHHTTIGEHTFVGPAAAIAGKVVIGKGCFVGINATIIDHVVLCDGARIGAASAVINNADDPGWYLGVPATRKA